MRLSTEKIAVEDGQSIVLDFIEPERADGGKTAVFVHGFGSHRRGDKAVYFGRQFAAAGWHFMSVDLRGHGDSDGTMLQHSLSRCLADLTAAMDWLPRRLAPPLLIGSSMGGSVSAWFNLLHPGRCRALVGVAPSFIFPGHYARRLTPEEMEDWRRTGRRTVKNEWLDIEVGYSVVEDGKQYDPQRLVAEHDLPTLIFHGLRDTSVDWRQSVAFLEHCPREDIHLVLLKHGDHRLTAHKAYMFDVMAAWLAGRDVPEEAPEW